MMLRLRATWSKVWVLLLACLVTAIAPSAATSAPGREADRGLDVFLHAPNSVKAGGTLELDVLALGFPTADRTVPLPGAEIEATWDPESLVVKGAETKPATAPVTVRQTSDAEGRVSLSLPVPEGYAGTIRLLVSVRAQGKERVREVSVERTTASDIQLFVSDSRVVPGSEVVGWALFTTDGGARPIVKAPIEFRLLQGPIVRFSRTISSDEAGSAMVRIPIPRDQEPDLRWTLHVRAVRTNADAAGAPPESSITLTPREEVPGTPELLAWFDDTQVPAGASTTLNLRLRDAAQDGVMSHPLWVWTGPRGTEAPRDDDAFRAVAKKLTTDGGGQAKLQVSMPSTVPLRGTSMQAVVRTELEGQPLRSDVSTDVTRKLAYVSLLPEGGELIPGVEQRLFLSLSDDAGEPAKRIGLSIKADGLSQEVTTNDEGDAELMWKVPKGVGAHRDVGPCPSGVATALTITAKPGTPNSLGVLEGPHCVHVNRDKTTLLRADRTIMRAGETLGLRVIGNNASRASFLVEASDMTRTLARWAPKGQDRIELAIPETMSGVVRISASIPRAGKEAASTSTTVLVLPNVIASVSGKQSGGRPAPGGTVTIDAQLSDEAGKGLTGSVAAVVIDKFGGGSFGALRNLDTKTSLCRDLGAPPDYCDAALSAKPETELLRSLFLQETRAKPTLPQLDPDASVDQQIDEAFRSVVRSLEGAIYQSSMSAEMQKDVRRSEGTTHRFNPELMTLVTEAMGEPPSMPGGETITLSDLLAIDKQITFDNVARRVTRLKLFEILNAMRTYRVAQALEPGEPLLSEPNVMLRKLVREGTVAEGLLLDPWGGKISFIKTGGDVIPFITVTKGYQLQSPGPDGRLGTADDVKSPFERVLTSKSPYAEAVGEDTIVDARFDMRVSEATVTQWDETLRKGTGTELGDSIGLGGMGLTGYGAGGGGMGGGSGRSRGGRVSYGVAKGIYYVSPAVRTDDQGRARIEVKLGDIETTWQVALIAIPDRARPAMSTLDIPVTVPLSAKVAMGAQWTEGDESEAMISLRNRTDRDLPVRVQAAAGGALALAKGETGVRTVTVGRQGAFLLRVPLRANGRGAGSLRVTTSADGAPTDLVTHEIEVLPQGEELSIARSVFASSGADLAPYLERKPYLPLGPARLVFERGYATILERALDSLRPEDLGARDALADSAIAAGRIHRYASQKGGDNSALAIRAKEAGRSAAAKLMSLSSRGDDASLLFAERIAATQLLSPEELPALAACPKDQKTLSIDDAVRGLEAEPDPDGGAIANCWTEFVARATNLLETAASPASIARGAMALGARPHRTLEAKTLARKLVERVRPTANGNITMAANASRADRSLVYSGLLAAGGFTGNKRELLLGWLLVQRDGRGSFGSAAATRAAVEVLIEEDEKLDPSAPVLVDFGEAGEKTLTLLPGKRESIEVPKGADRVFVKPERGNVLARLERRYLRPFSVAPRATNSGLALEVEWPAEPRAGRVGNLRAALRGGKTPELVEARIPLPPGTELAEPTTDVRQIQGVLYVRATLTSERALTIPLRFSLSGKLTVREATLAPLDREALPAVARARPLRVAPPETNAR